MTVERMSVSNRIEKATAGEEPDAKKQSPDFFREIDLNTHGVVVVDEMLCSLPYPETTQHLREVITALDIDTLRDVFSKYAAKSGVDSRTMTMPGIESIYFLKDEISGGATMTYSARPDCINVNVPYFDRLFKENHSLFVEGLFMKGLIHEYTHATGAVQYTAEQKTDSASTCWRMGLETNFYTTSATASLSEKKYTQVQVFRLLNEGITERISHEVLLEYLKRTSSKLSEDRLIAESHIEDDMRAGKSDDYAWARHLLVTITSALAEAVGLPEEVVWGGFVRHYYAGDLKAFDLMELLNDAFGADFGRRLMRVENGADIKNLIDGHPTVREHFLTTDRAQVWLRHLNIR